MNLLALDTSTDHAAVAVGRADGRRFVAAADPGRRHGRGLVPAIGDLLRQAGLATGDLDGLAVGLGPGSFTGLRVGVTAAKTLAYATGAPLVGFDSLELIARNAPAEAMRVAVVADAQRGDVFAADFDRMAPGDGLRRRTPTAVVPLDRWLERLGEGTWVVGPLSDAIIARIPPSVPVLGDEASRPRGEALIALASEAFADGRRDDPWFLEPYYFRRSAAEDLWDAAGKAARPHRERPAGSE